MCKILIVDDDAVVLKTVKDYFEKILVDHEIIATNATQEALHKIKNLKNVDIILFNGLNKSEPDGVTFAQSCRYNNPYVILLYMSSNLLDYKKLKRLSEIGIDGFIQKPISFETLEIKIINALTRSRSLINGKTCKHTSLEKAVDNFINKLEQTLLCCTKQKRIIIWPGKTS